MTTVKTLEEMETRMFNLVGGSGRKTAVVAGHFPLRSTLDGVRPAVNADDSFGIFPQYTFDLGCKLVSRAKDNDRDCKLVLLVDDHCLMIPAHWYVDGMRGNPQADEVRENVETFFKDFRIPDSFQGVMSNHGLTEKDFVPFSDDCLAFQESWYRQMFERENVGAFVGCAGEYELVLRDLAQRGFRKVISFIPERCLSPTCMAVGDYGVRRKQQGGLPKLNVMHAYLPTRSSIRSLWDLQRAVDEDGGVRLRT